MKFYFAPMEGVTDFIFRQIHHDMFPGVDRYYTPFLSPTSDGRFSSRALRDVLPERNKGIPVVPQLLTKNSADFLWAARLLAELGYEEVNLNLGCPSGTVVAKGKGAGMLADPDTLARFLEEICEQSPLPISVKTRLGLKSPEEFPALLNIFNRFPIAELIVHTRVREDFYRRPAVPEAFHTALESCAVPLCYNGDLTTAGRFSDFMEAFPQTSAVMMGRGAVADPALFQRCQGAHGAERNILKDFHDRLFDGYCHAFGSQRNALFRMKEFWFYHICLFEGDEKIAKRLRKTTDAGEYRDLTARIYEELPLRPEGALPTW